VLAGALGELLKEVGEDVRPVRELVAKIAGKAVQALEALRQQRLNIAIPQCTACGRRRGGIGLMPAQAGVACVPTDLWARVTLSTLDATVSLKPLPYLFFKCSGV